MPGFVQMEMYVALSHEKKAFMEKSRFLESENEKLRAESQKYKAELENIKEHMELVYSQYKIHLDQNIFLKAELEKTRACSIIPTADPSLPSPISLSPTTVVLDVSPCSSKSDRPPVSDNHLEKYPHRTEVQGTSPCEPDISDVAHTETIWCGPGSDSNDLPEDELPQVESEEYTGTKIVIEKVPDMKLPSSIPETKKQGKRPMLTTTSSIPFKKMKTNLNETSANFVCRVPPCKSTTFESLDEHQKHLVADHPEKPFLCSRCPYAADDRTRIRIHEKNHQKNELAFLEKQIGAHCKFCDITVASMSSLAKHQKLFH